LLEKNRINAPVARVEVLFFFAQREVGVGGGWGRLQAELFKRVRNEK
jgi:hypothetical protein